MVKSRKSGCIYYCGTNIHYNDEYKSCDLTYVINAVTQVRPFIVSGNVLIVESIVVPRTLE
ncbi:hypothetical protein [Peribacillus frigoritolerans]|uniref:hypothetical protein n=1 Tax=Peribacillus frigoritolerans TaxID=450367 RepID=UPI003B8C78F6